MKDDNGRRERRNDGRVRGRAICEKNKRVLVGEDKEEIKTAKDSLVYDYSEV